MVKKLRKMSVENLEKLGTIMAKETGGELRIRDKGTLEYIANEANKVDDPHKRASVVIISHRYKTPSF